MRCPLGSSSGAVAVEVLVVLVVHSIIDSDHMTTEVEHPGAVGLTETLRAKRVVGGPRRHDSPLEQHDEISAPSVVEFVGGHDHEPTSGTFLVDHRSDSLGRHHVQASHRLVEQQHVGLLCEALRHEHPLALSTGHLGQLPSAEMTHLQSVGCVDDRLTIDASHRAKGAEHRGSSETDDLLGSDQQVLGRVLGLEDVCNVPAETPRWFVGHGHRATAHREQASDGMEQRGFSRAVGADHCRDAAWYHERVHGEDGGVSAVDLDISQRDRVVGVSAHCWQSCQGGVDRKS